MAIPSPEAPDSGAAEAPEEMETPKLRESMALRLRLLRLVLGTKGHTRAFLLVAALALAAAIALALLGFPGFALIPALGGFGLCLTALLHSLFPPLAAKMDSLSRYASIGVWALLTLPLAFLGFSSTAVIVLVLFSGGFMMGAVLWRSLAKVLGTSEGTARPLEEEARGRDRRTCLTVIAVIAFASLTASFVMGYYRLHESGALGVALVFGNGGLLLGVLPAVSRVLGVTGSEGTPGKSVFRPLLRDILFVTVLAGLIGYEVSLATEGGGALSSVPAFVLLVVLLGYIGVLGRSLLSVGGKLEPHNPLLAASFGMLLLFSPLVVLLSNPPATVARLYGAAQAIGLVAVIVYIGLAQRWQEEIQRLSTRLQEAVNRGISVKVSIGEADEAASERGGGRRRRRLFRRRSRGRKKVGKAED